MTGISIKTLERFIKLLRDTNLIEFRGKTALVGGYFITKELKNKIEDKYFNDRIQHFRRMEFYQRPAGLVSFRR